MTAEMNTFRVQIPFDTILTVCRLMPPQSAANTAEGDEDVGVDTLRCADPDGKLPILRHIAEHVYRPQYLDTLGSSSVHRSLLPCSMCAAVASVRPLDRAGLSIFTSSSSAPWSYDTSEFFQRRGEGALEIGSGGVGRVFAGALQLSTFTIPVAIKAVFIPSHASTTAVDIERAAAEAALLSRIWHDQLRMSSAAPPTSNPSTSASIAVAGCQFMVRCYGVVASGFPSRESTKGQGLSERDSVQQRTSQSPSSVVPTGHASTHTSPMVRRGTCAASHKVATVQEYCNMGTLDHWIKRRCRAQNLTPPSLGTAARQATKSVSASVTKHSYDLKSASAPNLLSSEAEILAIGAAVSHALVYLHDTLGVLHRDVKPQNIMLSTLPSARWIADIAAAAERRLAGGAGATLSDKMVSVSVLLGDVGLSVESDAARTTCGTPYFIAPEVLSFASGSAGSRNHGRAAPATYTSACDIFSLGVTLQYVMSGGQDLGALGKQWTTSRSREARGGMLHAIPSHWIDERVHSNHAPNALTANPGAPLFTVRRSVLDLVNRMVHIQPSSRPSAREALSQFLVLSGTQRKDVLLRDIVWGAAMPPSGSVGHCVREDRAALVTYNMPPFLLSLQESAGLESALVRNRVMRLSKRSCDCGTPISQASTSALANCSSSQQQRSLDDAVACG